MCDFMDYYSVDQFSVHLVSRIYITFILFTGFQRPESVGEIILYFGRHFKP